MIASAQAAPGGSPIVARPPSGALLWAIGLAGVAASAAAATVAMTTGRTTEPEWQAVLFAWIVLTYTVGGAIAWWRRPDSRFGPLMVAAGAAMFVSSLYFADAAALFTLGQAFDLIPAALFLHVYLAYPSGRLGGVVPAGDRGRRLRLRRRPAGAQDDARRFGPDNLLAMWDEPDAGLIVDRVQLTALSACMPRRGRGAAGPPAARTPAGRCGGRWVALLVDSFVLALVMLALLFVFGAWGKVGLRRIQRVTLFILGLAPIAFGSRCSSAPGARRPWATSGRPPRQPEPADLRDALARALRDPSLELAYWLPEFGRTPTSTAGWRAAGARRPRAVTVIEREGEPVAALVHDPSLRDEPELLGGRHRGGRHRAREHAPAGRAAGAPGGAAGLAGAHRRGRPQRAQAPRAQPPRRRPAAARRALPRARRCWRRSSRATTRGRREHRARRRRSPPRSRSCARSPAACIPRSSAATASRWRWSSSPRARRCRWSSTVESTSGCRRRSRSRRTTSSARAWPTSASTRRRRRRRSTCRGATAT